MKPPQSRAVRPKGRLRLQCSAGTSVASRPAGPRMGLPPVELDDPAQAGPGEERPVRQGREDERVVAAGQPPQRGKVAVVVVVVGEEDGVHPGDRAEIDSGRRDAARPRPGHGAARSEKTGSVRTVADGAPQEERRLARPRSPTIPTEAGAGGRGRRSTSTLAGHGSARLVSFHLSRSSTPAVGCLARD